MNTTPSHERFQRRSAPRFLPAFALVAALTAALAAAAHAGEDPCQGQGNATLQVVGDVPPAVGTIFGLELGGRPFSPFMLIADIGTGPTEVPGVGTVCLDLGPRKRILIDSIRSGVPLLGVDGMFSTGVKIPQRPQLAGLTFFMQGIVADPSAPMGFAITNLVTVDVLPSIMETFATTDFRDDAQVSAIWDGNGRLEGIPVSAPRIQAYTPTESVFNLPHPLVERGNSTTIGCRMQMFYTNEKLAALPGESIIGMEWSPRSNFTFASTYQNVAIRLGHMRETKPQSLSYHFRGNHDHRVDPSPVTVFDGEYTLVNDSNAPWAPWPMFQTPFDYDNTLPLVFEFDMPEGGDTYQLFRNNSFQPMPNNRIIADGGAPTAAYGLEDTTYHTRFVLQQDRGVARSLVYKTDVPTPDYLEPYLNIGVLPEGSSITVEYEGYRDLDEDGVPDRVSGSAFQTDIDKIDGLPLVRFRVTMRANEAGEVPVLKSIVLPYQAQE